MKDWAGSLLSALKRHRLRLVLQEAGGFALAMAGIYAFASAALVYWTWLAPLQPGRLWVLVGLQIASLWFLPWAWFRYRRLNLSRLAAACDHAVPQAPDPYRMALQSQHMTEAERRAWNTYLAPWAEKLSPPRLPRQSKTPVLVFLAGVFAYAGLGLHAANQNQGKDFLWRTALPAWQALRLPQLDFIWPEKALQIAMGDTLNARIEVKQALEGQKIWAMLVPRAGGPARRLALAVQDRAVVLRMGPLETDQLLRLQGDNGESEWQSVTVLQAPVLSQAEIEVLPPAYTRRSVRRLSEGMLSGEVPEGSEVTWRLSAPRLRHLLLESGHAGEGNQANQAKQSDPSPRIDTLPALDSVSFSRTLSSDFRYGMRFCDEAWVCSPPRDPSMPHLLQARPDEAPQVALLAPLDGSPLPRMAPLPLLARLQDDYGISDLKLHWEVKGGPGAQRMPSARGTLPAKAWLNQVQDGNLAVLWNRSGVNLSAGQSLQLRLEACDDNPKRERACAFSETVTLIAPDLQAVAAQVSQQERDAMSSLRSAAERSQRAEREMQAAQGSRQHEGPPPLQAADIDRIMVHAPASHLNRLAALQRTQNLGAELPELHKALRENLEALPQVGQGILPLEHQQQNLARLQAKQANLEKALQNASTGPQAQAAPEKKQALEALKQELARNREDQKELAKNLAAKAREAEERAQQLDAALDEQRRMVEDLQSASQDVEKAMQQSRENGLASPELLRKMEKLQAMMQELLPDSLRALLQKQAEGQQVDLDEVKQRLQEVLDNKQEFEQGIDRALNLLEALQDRRQIESLRAQIDEMARRQKQLAEAARAATSPNASTPKAPAKRKDERKDKQKSLLESLNRTLDDFKQAANRRQGLQAAQKAIEKNQAAKAMQKASQSSGSSSEDEASAAEEAASELAGLSGSLGALLKQNEKKPRLDKKRLHQHLESSLELSRLQKRILSPAGERRSAGWFSQENVLYGAAARAALHLESELKQTLRSFEGGGRLILREARATAALCENAASSFQSEKGGAALHANHRLTREILRLLSMMNASSSGGGPGMAGGDGPPSPGDGQGEGEGEGEGQGSGDGMSPGEVGQALQGVGGRQMAVNQATYQLLRSLLEGRAPAPGGPGMQPGGSASDGPGGSGGSGKSGGTGQAGKEGSGKDGEGEGEGEGNGAEGGTEGGGSKPGKVGNQQGEIGESLEALAEKADESGGGAARLRDLAAEARALEEDLRRGRLDVDALQKKQERFQMRLLEAARALEERGKQEKRESESFTGRLTESQAPVLPRDELRKRIESMRRRVESLPLGDRDREVLDNFYRELLTR